MKSLMATLYVVGDFFWVAGDGVSEEASARGTNNDTYAYIRVFFIAATDAD